MRRLVLILMLTLPALAYSATPFLGGAGDSIMEGYNQHQTTIAGGESGSLAYDPIYCLSTNFSVTYTNVGYPGIKWDFVDSTEMPWILASPPHQVIFHCGINDIGAATPWATSLSHMNSVLSKCQTAGIVMILDEIFPDSNLSDAQSLTIRQWNTNYHAWAATNGVKVISSHDAMGQLRVSTGYLDDLKTAYNQGDGVHLSPAGVAAWWPLIIPYLGGTYYVAKTGNDSTGNGSQATPWLTMNYADEHIQPGDTLKVGAGIYDEWVLIDTAGLGTNARTRWIADGAVTNRGTFYIRANYVEVNGFQIVSGDPANFYGSCIAPKYSSVGDLIVSNYIHDCTNGIGLGMENNGAGPQNGPQFTTVLWNTVSNIDTGGNVPCISVCGANNLIASNWVGYAGHDGFQFFGTNNIMRGNFFTHLIGGYVGPGGVVSADHVDAFQTYGDSGQVCKWNLIEGNVWYWMPDAAVCQLTADNGSDIHDITVRNNVFCFVDLKGSIEVGGMNWFNNTFYRCGVSTGAGGDPISLAIFDPSKPGAGNRGQATNCVIRNNAFIECGPTGAGGYYNIVSVSTADNWATLYTTNDVWGTFNADYDFCNKTNNGTVVSFSETHGVSGGDPKLISATTNTSFNLKPMFLSPLIDVGTNITSLGVTNDFNRNARPLGQGMDIGAYEFDTNLMLHLDFDQEFVSSGKVLDTAGYTNDGWRFVATNWITSTSSIAGGSAGLFTINHWGHTNGANYYPASQYIAVTNSFGLGMLSNATISVWASFNTNGVNGIDKTVQTLDCLLDAVAGKNQTNGWRLGRWTAGTDRNVTFRIFKSDSDSDGAQILLFPTEAYNTSLNLYTVTVDCTNNQAIGYFNGSPVVTNTIGAPWIRVLPASSPWLCIGARAADDTPGLDFPNDCYHSGAMDDIRIYNRTLAAAEVANLYAGTGAALTGGGNSPAAPFNSGGTATATTARAVNTFVGH